MKQLFLIVLILMTGSLLPAAPLAATPAVPVTIVVRTATGAPVIGEEVRLIHHPSLTTETAVTNRDGHCVFHVPRGLYEVAFTPPLDDVSALAVAEGGLHHFGITVGDAAISYHFTFDTDGHVYFDDTPQAATPSPIKPRLVDLHFIGGAGQPTPTLLSATAFTAMLIPAMTPAPPVTVTPGQAGGTAAGHWLPLLLILFTGAILGLVGFLVNRRRAR